MRPVPDTLFKYQPMTLQAVRNLKSHGIYFSPPNAFNDPFDCGVIPRFTPLNDKAARRFAKQILRDSNAPKSMRDELDAMNTDEIQAILRREAENMFVNKRGELHNDRGISCFSETHKNMLMWSHYAGQHYGFCLEFHTGADPLKKIYPVTYVDEIPTLNLGAIYEQGDIEEILKMYCSKAKHWSYEREWRAIHVDPGQVYTYTNDVLKAVYFGARMQRQDVDLLCLILWCQNQDVELFQARLCNDKYTIEFEPLTYNPPSLREKQ